jgi:hypothetical protein
MVTFRILLPSTTADGSVCCERFGIAVDADELELLCQFYDHKSTEINELLDVLLI